MPVVPNLSTDAIIETKFLIDLQKCTEPIEVHIGAINIVIFIANPENLVA
jgi:hypothetical protein